MQNSAQNDEKTLSQGKILVVDDQEPFIKLFKRFYKNTDYFVEGTTNPSEALRLIESGGGYDLVVLDVMMPGKSGYEVCLELRKKYSLFELPVLFLTARMESESKLEGFAAGGNDYLTKPFDAAELIARSKTLVELKKLFERNQKLEANLRDHNQFLRMNIHDLRSPLTSIMMLAELLQSDVEQNKPAQESLATIISSSRQMVSMVSEILDFSNLECNNIEIKPETVSVSSLIAQVLDIQKPLANKKNQEIIFKQQTTESCVLVDSEKIIRAMGNIFSNAIKFTPESKSIFADIRPIVCNGEEFIRLEITDEGPGFTEVEKSQIFTKFGKFSARPTGGEYSSGLGLMIAKQLIELNGGKIQLDKKYSSGSKFIIDLPQKIKE